MLSHALLSPDHTPPLQQTQTLDPEPEAPNPETPCRATSTLQGSSTAAGAQMFPGHLGMPKSKPLLLFRQPYPMRCTAVLSRRFIEAIKASSSGGGGGSSTRGGGVVGVSMPPIYSGIPLCPHPILTIPQPPPPLPLEAFSPGIRVIILLACFQVPGSVFRDSMLGG